MAVNYLNSELYAEYIDLLYENNKYLFEKFPILEDRSININKLNQEIPNNDCFVKYKEFMIRFYNNLQYIDTKYLEQKYELICNELKEKSKDHEIILCSTNEPYNKSNIFIFMYMFGKLKANGIKINFIIRYIGDLLNLSNVIMPSRWNEYNQIINKSKFQKLLIVFFDDVTYSGTQLKGHILDVGANGGTAEITNTFSLYILEQLDIKI